MYCKHIFTTSRIVLEFLFSFTKIISICCYAGHVLSPLESSIRMTHYPSLPFSHPCTFHTVIVIFVVAISVVVVGILIFYYYYYCLLFLKVSLCVQIHFIHIFTAFYFQLMEMSRLDGELGRPALVCICSERQWLLWRYCRCLAFMS